MGAMMLESISCVNSVICFVAYTSIFISLVFYRREDGVRHSYTVAALSYLMAISALSGAFDIISGKANLDWHDSVFSVSFALLLLKSRGRAMLAAKIALLATRAKQIDQPFREEHQRKVA